MAKEVETKQVTPELEPRVKRAVEREQTRTGPWFRPDVDILERADEFVVMADLPGVDEKHVNVRLEEGVLSIEATPEREPDPGWTPLYAEYQAGGWAREFALSERIDAARIQASLRDGVLELRLPKLDRHRPRTIQVQVG
jgi:HSP20 family molecular chaperone IbpA